MLLERLITEPKTTPGVRSLFSRVDSFIDANITSQGVLPSICDSLYNLFHYLELWFSESIFSTYANSKTIVTPKILRKEADNWYVFWHSPPQYASGSSMFREHFPDQFWSIADLYPDLVRHLHV